MSECPERTAVEIVRRDLDNHISDYKSYVVGREQKHNTYSQTMSEFASSFNNLTAENKTLQEKVGYLEKKEAVHDVGISNLTQSVEKLNKTSGDNTKVLVQISTLIKTTVALGSTLGGTIVLLVGYIGSKLLGWW